MIKCRKCDFEVSGGMRHALQRNFCPCCGSALLGNSQKIRIDILKSKILEQEFSQKLDKDTIFDVSLFILTEFFPVKQATQSTDGDEPVVDEVVDSVDFSEEAVMPEPQTRKIQPQRQAPKAQSERSIRRFDEDEEDAQDEDDYEAIRREVRSEIIEQDDDLDLKVARLKRVAAETNIRKPGAMVRRISD